MKETFYFSHDYHARSDAKVTKLIKEMGYEGYGLFWGLVEMLYEADGFLEEDYDNIAYALRTDSERIAKLVKDYNLFSVASKKIHSNSVLARLRARKGKSEKARQSAVLRWNKQKKEDANAMRTQCEGNAIKESKVKESKVKEISISKDIEQSYGREDINKLLKEFETTMGFPSASNKDRIFATHLIKNYTPEQLTAMIKFCAEDGYVRVGSLEKLWFKRGDIIAGIKASFNKKNNIVIAQ